ncbi:hypothetical protein K402DRAFT_327951 [Aulographum hederae CBS 113979]|uniref:Lipocalin-like domain-containing protein n=1 Tax=Aulographum hederae CBS 113979 TaxID=1176131 RepID=A0A6G1H6H3_9PEZI|nr:hypothetical protein K402DRAFT_327951 [Aulographum hederae CBS 113979]
MAISLRTPFGFSNASAASTGPTTPPSLDFVKGTWHVTHSTLPMWKSKHNVRISYTALDPPPGTTTPRLDDLVEYTTSPSPSSKSKSVAGIDTPAKGEEDGWAYDWRGKGWLKIASSHWEVLGYGEEAGGNTWMVTYFAKTLFTPAGIDVYSREASGLKEESVGEIKQALAQLGNAEFKTLAESLFVVGKG